MSAGLNVHPSLRFQSDGAGGGGHPYDDLKPIPLREPRSLGGAPLCARISRQPESPEVGARPGACDSTGFQVLFQVNLAGGDLTAGKRHLFLSPTRQTEGERREGGRLRQLTLILWAPIEVQGQRGGTS